MLQNQLGPWQNREHWQPPPPNQTTEQQQSPGMSTEHRLRRRHSVKSFVCMMDFQKRFALSSFNTDRKGTKTVQNISVHSSLIFPKLNFLHKSCTIIKTRTFTLIQYYFLNPCTLFAFHQFFTKFFFPGPGSNPGSHMAEVLNPQSVDRYQSTAC